MPRLDHDHRVSATLTSDLRAKLDQAAQKLRLSRSAILRLALADYLEVDELGQKLRRAAGHSASLGRGAGTDQEVQGDFTS